MKKTYEVVAAVIVQDNCFFCAQRAMGDILENKWEFPGGKIKPNENNVQALKREIDEELGLDINVGDFIATIKHEYQDFKVILHAYYCYINSGELDLKEHQDYRWYTKDKLRTLDWAVADLPIVDLVINDYK